MDEGPGPAPGQVVGPATPYDPAAASAELRTAGPPPPRSGYASVLRNRRFLVYETSAILSSSGYAVYSISIPWLAYESTSSFLVVGLVLFLEVGIYALTFLAAPLVDRARDKRTIFLIGYPIQAAAALVLGLAALEGSLSLPLLLVLVGILSVAWDFEWAVFQVAPRALLSRDELFAGQGIASALGGGVQVGGFTLGAVFILVSGPAVAGFLYAGLLVAATILAALVPLRTARSAETAYLASFRAGWSYLRSPEGRPLLQLGALDAFAGFFSISPAVLIVLFANRSFSDPALAYSSLFTAYVVGGVSVDLLLGRLNPRRQVGRVLVLGLVVVALALVAAALTPPRLPLGIAAWAVVGAAIAAYTNSKYTFQWGYAPPDRLARVTGNLFVFPGTTGAVGALVLGSLVSRVTPFAAAATVAGVYGLAAVLSVTLPAIRRFRF